MNARTAVGGFLYSATSINKWQGTGVTVGGAVNAHATFDPAAVRTWTVTYPSTSQGDVPLQTNSDGGPSQRTITPARYGNVTVNARTTLNLSAGTYYLDSLDLEPGGTLQLTQTAGPIQLYVATSAIVRGAVIDAAGGTPKLLLGYAGTNPITIESSFTGTVVAPSAQLNLQPAIAYKGQYFAKTISVSAGASVTSRVMSDCQLPTTPKVSRVTMAISAPRMTIAKAVRALELRLCVSLKISAMTQELAAQQPASAATQPSQTGRCATTA